MSVAELDLAGPGEGKTVSVLGDRRSPKAVTSRGLPAASIATDGLVGGPCPPSTETVFPSPGPSKISSATLMTALRQSAVVS